MRFPSGCSPEQKVAGKSARRAASRSRIGKILASASCEGKNPAQHFSPRHGTKARGHYDPVAVMYRKTLYGPNPWQAWVTVEVAVGAPPWQKFCAQCYENSVRM